MRRFLPWRLAHLIAGAVVLFGTVSAASELTVEELRGRKIYHEGVSESGAPVSVIVSRGGSPIAATFLPCSGCHGADGKGRPEGGVKPSDITWKTLTASYGHQHDYGRSHPSFDEKSFARSVILGVDPGGNELDMAMPRYSMSEADMTDLAAYMKKIHLDLDPGISEDVLRVATLLPNEGQLGELGDAMHKVLQAYFDDINRAGGIHGRKLTLVRGSYSRDPVKASWQARDLLRTEDVFALVGGYATGVEKEYAELAEEFSIPQVGPSTVAPEDGGGLSSHTFYLLGGLAQQARVLSRYAADKLGGSDGSLAIVRPNAAIYESAQSAAFDSDDVLTLGYTAPFFDAVDTARMLKKQEVQAVVFFDLLMPGVFAGAEMFDVPKDYPGRVLVAYSSMPVDHTKSGIREFEQLHETHDLDYRHSVVQISAFVAAKVMVEGLKRAGRELSRESFVRSLEGLTDFQPGLMPPMSFNATRRVGALGGYVVGLDLDERRFGAESKWIALQP